MGVSLLRIPAVPFLKTVQQTQALLILVLSCTLWWLATVIPPFQSPDEVDHLKRAYLLGQGVLVLESGSINTSEPSIKGSGGRIDLGLLKYMDHHFKYAAKPELKRQSDDETAAKSIRWEGQQAFSLAPGTAYYFPLIYAPQSLGLLVGKAMGWSIDRSYQTARYCAILSITLLLLLASFLYPIPVTGMVLLYLPMTLFQMSSTSLDGISCALAVVCIAGFFRITAAEGDVSSLSLACWCAAIFLLVCSRIHMLPMLSLVAFAGLKVRRPAHALIGVFTVAATITWIFMASHTAIDPRVKLGLSSLELAKFYVFSPEEFLKVMVNTLSDATRLSFYWESFLGVLGWLDTPLQPHQYFVLTLLLVLVWSSFWKVFLNKSFDRSHAALCLVSLASIVLVFFALLITWTPHPAQQVQGVQGRYFLLPVMLLSFAFCRTGQPRTSHTFDLPLVSGCIFWAYSVWCLHETLTARYPTF